MALSPGRAPTKSTAKHRVKRTLQVEKHPDGGAAVNRDVFINCPFDPEYQLLFRAAVFTVIRCGFRVRCALETNDAGKTRFIKICEMIEESAFGFHDISRVELDSVNNLPRFNMPLELGVFLGDARKSNKPCIIFDSMPYRYQKYISDISGQDISSHDGDPSKLVVEFVNWLRHHTKNSLVIPGGQHVASEHKNFERKFPVICKRRNMTLDDVKFKDLESMVIAHIESTQAVKPQKPLKFGARASGSKSLKSGSKPIRTRKRT